MTGDPKSEATSPESARQPEQTGDWEGTRDSVREIFSPKAAEPEAAPVLASVAAPENTNQENASQELQDALADDKELETLEFESPEVAKHLEVATGNMADEFEWENEADEVPSDEPASLPTNLPEAEAKASPPAPPPLAISPVALTNPVAPTPAKKPESAPPAPPASLGISNDLEEETYAPTVTSQGPKVGEVVDGYHLNNDLGGGWFTANAVSSGPSLDVFVKPNPLWTALKPHKMLPKTTQAGQVTVLEPTGGELVKGPLDSVKAQGYVLELARLLFALEKQGYAVTDLDPETLRVTPEGLKLRFPPRVARLGDKVEPILRDGFTPPEVLSGQAADARSGVYLLGAQLYQWLSGQPLPVEGPSPMLLAGVRPAGMPQLLNQMLAPEKGRLTPTELLEVLKTKTAPLPAYQLAAATNIGLNPDRPANEDSYGFVWRQIGAHGNDQLVLRALVSDGMGGMAAGEVASTAAVRGFLSSDKTTLPDMVWDANAAVLSDMQGRDGGCTISAVEIVGSQMQLGHVGDTRAYLLANGPDGKTSVTQISKDHSYVAAMVASGQMTPEEAQVSPERNKVLRSLGSLRQPQANYVYTLPEPLTLAVGNRVLLVSDGVWGEVEPATLQDILQHEPSLQRVVDHLLELALEAGAPDNITALVIERVK